MTDNQTTALAITIGVIAIGLFCWLWWLTREPKD